MLTWCVFAAHIFRRPEAQRVPDTATSGSDSAGCRGVRQSADIPTTSQRVQCRWRLSKTTLATLSGRQTIRTRTRRKTEENCRAMKRAAGATPLLDRSSDWHGCLGSEAPYARRSLTRRRCCVMPRYPRSARSGTARYHSDHFLPDRFRFSSVHRV